MITVARAATQRQSPGHMTPRTPIRVERGVPPVERQLLWFRRTIGVNLAAARRERAALIAQTRRGEVPV